MTLNNIYLLEHLLKVPSVSGFEDKAVKCYEDFMHEHGIDTFRDALDNCYAIINPKAEFRLMLEAHIDEIGFQVTYIDDSGFVYIRQNGGIDRACVPGSQVYIHTLNEELVLGIIGKSPIHVLKPDERGKVPELEDLWIDTGLPVEIVKEKVSVGDFVSFAPNFKYIGDYGITSKGLDDKVGVYVVAEVMQRLSEKHLDIGVYAVVAVQEEVGCKGAKTCIANVNPNMSVSIDVGFATDVPNISKKKYGDIALGKGPVLNHHTDCNRGMVKLLKTVADENNIKIQMAANPISTGGTDTASLQVSGKGVKTLLLSIPNRYMHTQVEMCDKRDLEETIQLLISWILEMDQRVKNNETIY